MLRHLGSSLRCCCLLGGAALAAPEAAVSATSPDGKLLAQAKEKAIRIYDNQTQSELVTLLGHANRVTALSFFSGRAAPGLGE